MNRASITSFERAKNVKKHKVLILPRSFRKECDAIRSQGTAKCCNNKETYKDDGEVFMM